MFKKYHVGRFINNIMKAKGLTIAQLEFNSNVSQKHISNIINEKVDLTLDIAIKIAPYLDVPSELLINLQISYKEYCAKVNNELELLQIFSKAKINYKDFLDLNLEKRKLDLFLQDRNKFMENSFIKYYSPAKPAALKEWLFLEMLGKIKIDSEYSLNKEGLSNYMQNEMLNILVNANTSPLAAEAIIKIKKDLKQFGITVKIKKTNIKSNLESLVKVDKQGAVILIDYNNDFAKIVFLIVHELMHIVSSDKDNENDSLISELAVSLLIGNENVQILKDVNDELMEQIINARDDYGFNVYLFDSARKYIHKKYTKENILLVGEEILDDYIY